MSAQTTDTHKDSQPPPDVNSRLAIDDPGQSVDGVRSLGETFSVNTTVPLFGKEGKVAKELLTPEDVGSKQANGLSMVYGFDTDEGIMSQSFNMAAAKEWVDKNATHSTCVSTAANCTVGLGFISDQERKAAAGEAQQTGLSQDQVLMFVQDPDYIESKVDTTLDPLCVVDFNDLIIRAGNDYFSIGAGMVEVVRDPADPITGEVMALYYAPVETKLAVNEGNGKDYYWVDGYSFASDTSGTAYARFGDKQRFMDEVAGKGDTGMSLDPNDYSEIIYIPSPNNSHPLYGKPKWLAAAPAMETILAAWDEKHSDYVNRCVMDYLLFIHGTSPIPAKDWAKITAAMSSSNGPGKQHKTIAHAWASSEDTKIDFHQLTKDSKTDEAFQKNYEVVKLEIVTAHQTPPLLAGIQIPGKLGANNEFINALMSYQALSIGPAQRRVSKILGRTLGNNDLSGLGLTSDSFNLRKVTDYINLQMADTTSRMRQSVSEAGQEGRDLSEGVRD